MKKTMLESAAELTAQLNQIDQTNGPWQFEIVYPKDRHISNIKEDILDELMMLANLKERGIITLEYFSKKKQELIENK
jgi:hypothetical protein